MSNWLTRLQLDYTLNTVVTRLTMIESPTAEMTFSTPAKEHDLAEPDAPLEKEPLLDIEQAPTTVVIAPVKPITSKIRKTVCHLKTEAGRSSRWRGLGWGLLYGFVFHFTHNLFTGLLPNFRPITNVVATVGAGLISARLHTAWTHAVIARPTEKKWMARMPAIKTLKYLALPTVVLALVVETSGYLVMSCWFLLGLDRVQPQHHAYNNAQLAAIFAKFAIMAVMVLHVVLFIILPAHVTLIRVEASLLPADEDTIVPFDRSFGGKVEPAVLGGSGAVKFVDAWRSFDWEARRRFIKLQFKIMGIFIALTVFASMVMGAEFAAIMAVAQ